MQVVAIFNCAAMSCNCADLSASTAAVVAFIDAVFVLYSKFTAVSWTSVVLLQPEMCSSCRLGAWTAVIALSGCSSCCCSKVGCMNCSYNIVWVQLQLPMCPCVWHTIPVLMVRTGKEKIRMEHGWGGQVRTKDGIKFLFWNMCGLTLLQQSFLTTQWQG